MKTFKVIGLLALVFLAGFSGGVVATKIVVRQMVNKAVHPLGTGGPVELNLDRKLRLDQQQRQQVHAILKDSRDKLRAVREEFQPRFNGIILETRTNILAVLRPEQQQRFEEFLENNHQFLPVREPLPPKKN